MLSKLVVKLYSVLLELALWAMLVVGFIVGWKEEGVIGGVVGLIAASVFGAVILGAFLVLDDIRKKVNANESRGKDDT